MPPKATKPRTKAKPASSRKRKADKPAKRKASAGKPRSGVLSVGIRYFTAAVIVFVFSAAFYYFYIRPYSYRWKPCYGQKGYGVCLPYSYKVHGLDISHHQGNIDWHALGQNRFNKFPLHFVFMKATEGGDHTDSAFVRNFGKAYEHGFIRGAYHFFSPGTDPMKQADFFIRTVRLKPGDLAPVLDIELKGKKNPEDLQAVLRIWLKRIESHYGVKPIIYASYKFKMKYLNDSVFNSYPYWIAHYYVDSVRYRGRWDFWQHTDAGQVPGIDADVDLNVFNGTLEELQKLTIPRRE